MNARSRPVSAALIGILLGGIACTSYKQIDIGEINRYDEVRVALRDGAKRVVHHPYAGSDTLRGFSVPVTIAAVSVAGGDTVRHYHSDAPYSDIVIPLEDIASAERKKTDALKSLGLAAAIGALSFGVFVALLAITWDDSW